MEEDEVNKETEKLTNDVTWGVPLSMLYGNVSDDIQPDITTEQAKAFKTFSDQVKESRAKAMATAVANALSSVLSNQGYARRFLNGQASKKSKMTRNKTYQVDELRIQELLSKEAAYDRIQTLLTTLGFDASTPEQCADICEALVTDKPQTLDMLGMQTKISIVKSMLESTCTQQSCTDLHALNANIRCFGLACRLEPSKAGRYSIGVFDKATKELLYVFEP